MLVCGGVYTDGPGGYLASAEIFDPVTNSFSSTGIGAMGTARTGAVAAPLADGRVLVAGGFDGSTRLSSAEIFALTGDQPDGLPPRQLPVPEVPVQPPNAFGFTVKGQRLLVRVQAAGRVSVSDAAAQPDALPAKKKKMKRRLLKTSGTSGGPPTITVALHLSKLAKQRLRRKGAVAVRARITFAPRGGLADTKTAKLKIKGKKKK